MYRTVWRVLLAACLFGIAAAVPAVNHGDARNAIHSSGDFIDYLYNDCLKKDSVTCMKFISFWDGMVNSKDSIPLAEGVTVVKTQDDGSPRSLDDDGDIASMVVNRVERFLETHTIKFDLKGTDVLNVVSNAGRALGDAADSFGLTENDSTTAEESRGKKKKAQKILMPLLLALKLKAAALIPLALGAIALIAGKALVIGKIALVLAAIIGLKKLLSHQKSVTYEFVSHPHHSSSSSSSHDSWSGGDGGYGGGSSGGHSGWGRAAVAADAHDVAYRAQKPQQ